MSRLKATYIKNLRVEKGMTQQELADLVNVRRETIVRLENGNYNRECPKVCVNLQTDVR